MFDNIGRKIKNLATVVSTLGIGLSCILGIAMVAYNFNIFFAFITALAGVLLSWLGSFFLYGFGELIDSNCEIKEQNAKIIMNLEKLNSSIKSDSTKDAP